MVGTQDGTTPLLLAAQHGLGRHVGVLLRHKADVKAVDKVCAARALWGSVLCVARLARGAATRLTYTGEPAAEQRLRHHFMRGEWHTGNL